nr:immunoglobulin light chain junction region [Macaca mulatta]
CMQAPDFPLTF